MMRLQTEFHDLLTQDAEANVRAGSLVRMLWRRSSLSKEMPMFGSVEDFPLVVDLADDELGVSSAIVVWAQLHRYKTEYSFSVSVSTLR